MPIEGLKIPSGDEIAAGAIATGDFSKLGGARKTAKAYADAMRAAGWYRGGEIIELPPRKGRKPATQTA